MHVTDPWWQLFLVSSWLLFQSNNEVNGSFTSLQNMDAGSALFRVPFKAIKLFRLFRWPYELGRKSFLLLLLWFLYPKLLGLGGPLFKCIDGHTSASSHVAPEFLKFHKLSIIHQPLSMWIPCHRLDTSHCQRHRLLILWMLRRFCWERPLDWLSYLWSRSASGLCARFAPVPFQIEIDFCRE